MPIIALTSIDGGLFHSPGSLLCFIGLVEEHHEVLITFLAFDDGDLGTDRDTGFDVGVQSNSNFPRRISGRKCFHIAV